MTAATDNAVHLTPEHVGVVQRADAEFARFEPTDDARALLVNCETEALEAVEQDERDGVQADDLDIARARLVMLRTFRKLVEDVMAEAEDLTGSERAR